MKFKFLADAACDVPKDLAEKFDINIIPIEVRFGEKMYPDGLSGEQFYNELKTNPELPKTSMPNSYKFSNFYKDYVNDKDTFIITIVISMELSTTKIQAQNAADELGMKNVFIEESAAATVAQGAIIVELAKFCQTCDDIEKIKEEFYRLRRTCQLYAVINDLKYLRHSGRLSGASATIGSMLNIKPIVSIVDGKVVNVAKCMGSNKAEAYIMDTIKNMDEHRPLYLIHSHTPEKVNAMIERHKKHLPAGQEHIEQEIGCIVGSHVGAGCYGIVYFNKD